MTEKGVTMIVKKIGMLIAVFLFSSTLATAAELKVIDSAITTAVVDQMPVDRISAHPADYGKLFCFTRIVGATEETSVVHVWYYQGQEMARVSLPVKSADWRTYSSKRFLPQWTGEWRVAVLDSQQRELAAMTFVLE